MSLLKRHEQIDIHTLELKMQNHSILIMNSTNSKVMLYPWIGIEYVKEIVR